jgi:hypothetical protein
MQAASKPTLPGQKSLWGNVITAEKRVPFKAKTIADAEEKTKRYYIFVNNTVRNDKTGRDYDVVVKEAEQAYKLLNEAGNVDAINSVVLPAAGPAQPPPPPVPSVAWTQIAPKPGWEPRSAELGTDSSSPPNAAAPSFDVPPALKSLPPSEAESACKFLWNGFADEKEAKLDIDKIFKADVQQHALFTRALVDCANVWHKRDIPSRLKQWSSDRQRKMQAESKIGDAISLLNSSLKGVRTNLVELSNLPAVVGTAASSRTAVAKAEVLTDLVRELTHLRLLIEDAHKRLHGSLSKRGALGNQPWTTLPNSQCRAL